ncbi:hypothetical protein CC86DRAFT_121156 [Ophiobolus disseminans]|uniref:Uncharacterized protein n=1 Tax=Ophiobolus disseminans TaxID=1469910 RepID=A0A6A6ZH38_9PLEO|nr:hypothetical protein CC86DRAFT_121156 [Ophiobolus disseminans]
MWFLLRPGIRLFDIKVTRDMTISLEQGQESSSLIIVHGLYPHNNISLAQIHMIKLTCGSFVDKCTALACSPDATLNGNDSHPCKDLRRDLMMLNHVPCYANKKRAYRHLRRALKRCASMAAGAQRHCFRTIHSYRCRSSWGGRCRGCQHPGSWRR